MGDPTFGWPNTSVVPNDTTNLNWVRQGYTGTLAQRVVWDDSVPVMQSLGCHTVKAEIQSTDLGWPSSSATTVQRAQIGKGPGWADFGAQDGQTHWYGYAVATNSGYVPHYAAYSGDFNLLQSFHCYPINGVWGPKANVQLEVSTEAPASGANWWTANTTLTRINPPRLAIALSGGDQTDPNWWLKDGTLSGTNRIYLGPTFVPGHLYRIQFKITWGSALNGAVQWWVDGVKYADVSGINDLWHSGSTVDTGVYPLFENYRQYDTSLPTDDVYYGGIVVGATQSDVAIP